jgi:plasmid stabilization system protein ParE
MYNLIIKNEAYLDALQAYLYYENEQPGLGDRFLNTLLLCYDALAKNPQYYSFVSDNKGQIFRDIKVDKFPYLVVFEISGNDVIVFAVHNTHKKPLRRE